MSGTGAQRLTAVLRREPPAALIDAVADAELLRLAERIEAARERQHATVERAGERALSTLPRLLRGPVRRLAGG